MDFRGITEFLKDSLKYIIVAAVVLSVLDKKRKNA